MFCFWFQFGFFTDISGLDTVYGKVAWTLDFWDSASSTSDSLPRVGDDNISFPGVGVNIRFPRVGDVNISPGWVSSTSYRSQEYRSSTSESQRWVSPTTDSPVWVSSKSDSLGWVSSTLDFLGWVSPTLDSLGWVSSTLDSLGWVSSTLISWRGYHHHQWLVLALLQCLTHPSDSNS